MSFDKRFILVVIIITVKYVAGTRLDAARGTVVTDRCNESVKKGNKKSGLFTGRSLQRGEGGREISQERRCTMQSRLTPRHTD
jgi:hypothetical protein